MSFIKTKNKARLFYQDWGTGKPIVFLHAWAMNSDMWELHMLHFNEQKMRCIAFDSRGHGRSDRDGAPYNYDTYSEELERLVSELDLRDVTLVGHSMGCGTIIRYLTRYGTDRISNIVLIAPTLPYLLQTEDNPQGVDFGCFEATRKAIRKDFPNWLTENGNAFYVPEYTGVSEAVITWTRNMILTTSLKAAIEGTHQVSETDFREELKKVTLPTLLVHGTADASIPVHFGRMAAEIIPNCTYKEYKGAPHGIFLTHFDQLNQDILDFIQSEQKA
ncbi:alpha/beta fold hydrolase [Mucilaginibacter sp. HD30]